MILSTTRCLNCRLAWREECQDYIDLKHKLFLTEMGLDERITEYKKLATKKGCKV